MAKLKSWRANRAFATPIFRLPSGRPCPLLPPLKTKAKAKAAGEAPLYQLKITLQWSKPAIWRRVMVRSDLRLDRLHQVIQLVMPWTNSHMHQFIAGDVYYGPADQEGAETRDESRHTLAELAPAAKNKFQYEYDFGDGWLHEVTVEKILPPDPACKHPICLGGANACPPDDCGGIPGYYDLLEILKHPKHPEHEHYLEWIGGEWDAKAFDLAGTNAQLKRLKA